LAIICKLREEVLESIILNLLEILADPLIKIILLQYFVDLIQGDDLLHVVLNREKDLLVCDHLAFIEFLMSFQAYLLYSKKLHREERAEIVISLAFEGTLRGGTYCFFLH
jgi:hypothetical protein